MDWGDTKAFTTPEQVSITYSLAGIGTRFAACLFDSILHVFALLLVFAIVALFDIGLGSIFRRFFEGDFNLPGWLLPIVIIVFFVIFWGYYMFWETLWNGQTPGKRMCGIRVMREGGFPIDFRAAFIRNIVRYVDFLPFCYGVGAVTMFMSKDSKRLGDYAAGTIVVVDSRKPAPPTPAKAAPNAEASTSTPGISADAAPTYRVLGDPALLSLRALTRDQFLVVERFLDRRDELPAKVRPDLARQIATPLVTLIGLPPPEDGFAYEDFLVELAAAYRSRPRG